jgi:pimeloyl-ACP methyl ester carboxylesterase
MKVIKKIFIILCWIVFSIVAVSTVWWFWPASTPSISSDDNKSVAQLEFILIGGVEQCVLTRSENRDNPILLFLHGGPGMPMMYLAHEFQEPLEEHFTVVQWDRRGAGKTFSRNIPPIKSMNVRQLINDAYELIDTLKRRHDQDKIILAGHSFGSYLGSIMVNERPELFSAYVSIGQVVDDNRAITLQKAFIRKEAGLRGRHDVLVALDSTENTYLENWLFEFGGELKNSTSFFPLIWSGLKAAEYRLSEAMAVAKGSSFSSTNMKYNVLESSIYNEIQVYKIPIYFFVGNWDYTTPHTLITEYYQMIEAPEKKIFYFDNSAHFPFFEEPEKFCEALIKILED